MSSAAGRSLGADDRSAINAHLAQTAEAMGLKDPPQVAIVRVVPAAEFLATKVACLHDHGFADAAVNVDGTGVEIELPGGAQLDAYNLAAYTCEAEYPRDPAQDDSRMTRDQKIVAYRYLAQTLVACLAEHGFTVHDVPTQETFLAGWQDTAPWNPYEQITVAVPDDVRAACHQDPPADLIWGAG